MKKRKLRIFPVISLIVFVIVVVYACIIIKDVFKKDVEDNTNTPDTEVSLPDNTTENVTPDNDSNEDPDDTPQTSVEIPEEDKTEFKSDAPKPLYTHAELLELFDDTILDKSEDAGQEYIDDMIFIGDSTTHGMAYYGVLKGGKNTNQVWTPKSGTLAMWNLLTENIVYPEDDSEMSIADAIHLKTPKTVVLTLGVNGVSSLSEENFKKYYNDLVKIIKEKSPETNIILQSIYPVCDYYEVKSISMEKINRANVWIAEIAKENEVYYLNTISALVGENGYLINDYCNGDGIHISKAGFEVILDYIRTHAID
ncbi:MAG: hypothetical protein E7582_03725 [Ruminococcaceae bacterium]|nr:hypothetical protein [Oscillospiraceae bacterium]